MEAVDEKEGGNVGVLQLWSFVRVVRNCGLAALTVAAATNFGSAEFFVR